MCLPRPDLPLRQSGLQASRLLDTDSRVDRSSAGWVRADAYPVQVLPAMDAGVADFYVGDFVVQAVGKLIGRNIAAKSAELQINAFARFLSDSRAVAAS